MLSSPLASLMLSSPLASLMLSSWTGFTSTHSATKHSSRASAHCCRRIPPPPRSPSRAAHGSNRVLPPPPVNSANYPNSPKNGGVSNMAAPWNQSSPPPPPLFSSSVSWYAGGINPQNPKSVALFQTLQRIQSYLDLPDVSRDCDSLRERFVDECGPGGTDKPMQLKRHRSFADFVLLKAKETSVFRRRSIVASNAVLTPVAHGWHSYEEVSSCGHHPPVILYTPLWNLLLYIRSPCFSFKYMHTSVAVTPLTTDPWCQIIPSFLSLTERKRR